jgi:lipid-binding SYLF domain-containing protein
MRASTAIRPALLGSILALAAASAAAAPTNDDDDVKLAQAIAVLHDFTNDEKNGIPVELLARARGIVVIPNLIRGGFFIGGRRGRGVLTVRTPSGDWSNPAFVTLTGGSIGWQFGVESADTILVFANDRSVANIATGKFTFAGDAAAQAGPLGRRSMAAITFRSEVYVYSHNRGLYAGASLEGARLDVSEQDNARFYAGTGAKALAPQNVAIPASAGRFLDALRRASAPLAPPPPGGSEQHEQSEGATTYPLGKGPE